MMETMRALTNRLFSKTREHLRVMTSGERWTAALALGLALVMITIGLPSNTRVIAAPPVQHSAPPAVVEAVPPMLPPVVVPPPVVPVAYVPPERPFREPELPKPSPHRPAAGCSFDAGMPVPIAATTVEQLKSIQDSYEEGTGMATPVNLASVVAFAGGCTDALPEAEVLVQAADALRQVYSALEAAGVPTIDLPDPPVVSLPEIPKQLDPVMAGLAPAILPICGGVSTALALAPAAGTLLPFPSSEWLPYLWPARAVCARFNVYQPPQTTSAATDPLAVR